MSDTFDAGFITVYEREIYLALQSYGGRLPNRCTVGSLQGATVSWPKLGAGTVEKNPARNSPVDFGNRETTTVTATLDNFRTAEVIDDLDEFKANANYRAGYTTTMVGELGSQADLEIITALNAIATDYATGTAQNVDKTLFATVRYLVESNNFHENGENMVTWVVSPAAAQDIRVVTEMISKDFGDGSVGTRALQPIFGVDIVIVPELATLLDTTVDHYSYLFNKPAMGWRWGKQITAVGERRVDLDGWQILAKMSAVGKGLDAAAVHKIKLNTAA